MEVQGLKADIVVREGGRAKCVIEVKIFDEGCNAYLIMTDLHKGDPVDFSNYVTVYAGVLVCEVAGRNLEQRKRILEDVIKEPIEYSEPCRAQGDKWSWCFGCAKRTSPTP